MQGITRRRLLGIAGVTTAAGVAGTVAMTQRTSALQIQSGEFQVHDYEHTGDVETVDLEVDVQLIWETNQDVDHIDVALSVGERGQDLTELETKTLQNISTAGEETITLSANVLESSSLAQSSFTLAAGQSRRDVEVDAILTAQLKDNGETIAEDELQDYGLIQVYEDTTEFTTTAEGAFEVA